MLDERSKGKLRPSDFTKKKRNDVVIGKRDQSKKKKKRTMMRRKPLAKLKKIAYKEYTYKFMMSS